MSKLLSLDIQNNHLPDGNSSKIGKLGEQIAAQFLVEKGYRLVATNFKVPIGRNRLGAQVTGEIDLIGYDQKWLCFIEVKTRTSDAFASPLAAVDLRKQRQIIRTAKRYRKIFNLKNINFRYDVVSIVLPENSKPKIDLFKGFWDEGKFAKKFWTND